MKRKKSERVRLMEELDELFSLKVRERDKYTCQKCGSKSKYVAAAHIFSINNQAVRWNINNGLTLCYPCHIWWSHREPVEFTLWIQEKIQYWKFIALEMESVKEFRFEVGNYKSIKDTLNGTIPKAF